VAIRDERSIFATARGIGRSFDPCSVILSSVNLRLMFNFDETTLAANLRRSQVLVALKQRVFRKKHGNALHFTFGGSAIECWMRESVVESGTFDKVRAGSTRAVVQSMATDLGAILRYPHCLGPISEWVFAWANSTHARTSENARIWGARRTSIPSKLGQLRRPRGGWSGGSKRWGMGGP
jgi:hypothetical protein